MGTLAEKLQYTKAAVEDIAAAIEEKGISTGDYALGDYGNRIRAAITPPFHDGIINVPNNYGESVEWVASCVYEFKDGDIFVYNSGIGYNIYFKYETKVFSAFFGTEYTNSFGSQYICSDPVKITTTGAVDYAVRIMDIRPLNNRQILVLWTHQLNAEGTNWAPFYAQIITVKQDLDVLTTQLSSSVSLLPSGTHYVEGKEVAGVRAFLDMTPLKNDMSRIVELGLLLQKDTYTSAGVHSASVLYWNDIRVTTTQLALNSTAWTTLCSVTPSADYNYLAHYRSNLYGWVYQYQTTSANETMKLVARPDGRAVNNFVNSNIEVNGIYAPNCFSGCYILGVLDDGNVLAGDYSFDHDNPYIYYLRLYVNEYDPLKNEWNQIAVLHADVPSNEFDPKDAIKLILLPNNILLNTLSGYVWHIKKTDLKEYSASYLGKFGIHNYDTVHARSYQFDGLYSNKFFGIGQGDYFFPGSLYKDRDNRPLSFEGSIYGASSITLGSAGADIVELPFKTVKLGAQRTFKIVNGKITATRGISLRGRQISVTVSVKEAPIGIKVKVYHNRDVIEEMSKVFHSVDGDLDFSTFEINADPFNTAVPISFCEGDILSVVAEKIEGPGNCKIYADITAVSGTLLD